MLVINGGYVYDTELLSRLPEVHPSVNAERLLPEDVSLSFTDITPEERLQLYELTRIADAALQRFRCQVQVRRFKPADLPALFTLSQESSSLRSLEKAEEVSTPAFSSVLSSLTGKFEESAYATLYLNLDNPVVSRIFQPQHAQMLVVAVEMLYVNSLMLGHYPMSRAEMGVLNQGILQFMEWGLSANTNNNTAHGGQE